MEQLIADEIERLRTAYNKNAAELGWPQMSADEWVKTVSTPLIDPQMELVRAEDQQYPDRMCAWCFHPRSSPECNFAQQHTPYREMFA